MIRWWVDHPVNQDLYCVFVVQSHDDHPESDQWYWHEGRWHVAPIGAIIQPALQLPGILAHQMVEEGREDITEIAHMILELCEKIWEATNEREPANANNPSGPEQEVRLPSTDDSTSR